MAASYSQLGEVCSHPDFQSRVNVAMNSCALSVYDEASTTAGHAARAAFATKVMNGTYNLPAACFAIVSGSTIANEADPTLPGDGVKDADILTEVYTVWDCLSGA
jgi:hypothetical protein